MFLICHMTYPQRFFLHDIYTVLFFCHMTYPQLFSVTWHIHSSFYYLTYQRFFVSHDVYTALFCITWHIHCSLLSNDVSIDLFCRMTYPQFSFVKWNIHLSFLSHDVSTVLFAISRIHSSFFFFLFVFVFCCFSVCPKVFFPILLLLAVVISISLLLFVYSSNTWIVESTQSSTLECPFPSFIDQWSQSIPSLNGKALCIINFLVLWFICLSSSRVHFIKDLPRTIDNRDGWCENQRNPC